jgi:hypothetical protein
MKSFIASDPASFRGGIKHAGAAAGSARLLPQSPQYRRQLIPNFARRADVSEASPTIS